MTTPSSFGGVEAKRANPIAEFEHDPKGTIPLNRTMAEHAAKRNPNRRPTHPGELLREEVIPPTGKTKTEIADYSIAP
jgi:hypothetical protein